MNHTGIGLVGAGWMGHGLLRKLAAREDVEIRAIVGRDVERVRPILNELDLPSSTYRADFDSLLTDPSIHSIWLTNPNSFHGPQALAAMKAGKHVFCEKPAATSYADFCAQIDVQQKNPQLISYVNYILYFDPLEQRLRQMIAGGAFGTVTQIQVNYRNQMNVAGPKAWKLSKTMMGDAFGMAINHALSVMLLAMASQAKPASVFATSAPAKVKPFEAEPIWTIQLTFDNGATGVCLGNIESNNGYDAYHNITGTAGAFVFDPGHAQAQKVRYWSQRDTDGKWIWPLDNARCAAEGADALAWPANTSTPDSADIIHHQTAACVDHFLECIRLGKQSPLSFVGTGPIGEIGWAAQISAAKKQPVTLPLDRRMAAEFFTGKL
jgi:predicted dehydrogenase